MSPEQWAGLRQRIELAESIIAARGGLDHSAAYLAARGPEMARRLNPDLCLDATVFAEPKRSVVSEAADLLDRLSAAVEPADRDASDTALAHAILARCEVLAARAKARLQS